MAGKKNIVIGITGASGSGKSLLTTTVVDDIGSDKVAVISQDSYYRDQSHLPFEIREKTNYDHPKAFDHELLFEHLAKLQQGIAIDVPVYDFTRHTRSSNTIKVAQHELIVLEGILLFAEKKIREIIDIKIFIDTPLDLCFIRRLERDTIARGRSIRSVVDQYLSTVKPMFHKFIEPSRKHADIVVPGGGKNKVAIDIIKAKIRELLKEAA